MPKKPNSPARPLAPHVQRALAGPEAPAGTVQRSARPAVPSSTGQHLAPHVQKAIGSTPTGSGSAQPSQSTPPSQPLAPHVQNALGNHGSSKAPQPSRPRGASSGPQRPSAPQVARVIGRESATVQAAGFLSSPAAPSAPSSSILQPRFRSPVVQPVFDEVDYDYYDDHSATPQSLVDPALRKANDTYGGKRVFGFYRYQLDGGAGAQDSGVIWSEEIQGNAADVENHAEGRILQELRCRNDLDSFLWITLTILYSPCNGCQEKNLPAIRALFVPDGDQPGGPDRPQLSCFYLYPYKGNLAGIDTGLTGWSVLPYEKDDQGRWFKGVKNQYKSLL